MIKFRLKRDWNIDTDILGKKSHILIYKEGELFLPNQQGLYFIKNPLGQEILLTKEDMLSSKDNNNENMFEQIIEQNIDIKISPIGNDEEIQDYRIQLDVRVSRKKAIEIENYLRETLYKML